MNFSQNLLGLAGIKCVETPLEMNREEALEWLRTQEADVVVFCAADEGFSEVSDLIQNIRKNVNPPIFILAGKPADSDSLKSAGIDYFIFRKMNAPEFLTTLLGKLMKERAKS